VVAVFRKDHAQSKTWHAMVIQPNPIPRLPIASRSPIAQMILETSQAIRLPPCAPVVHGLLSAFRKK
jgi:hypothetical protein